jgi:hypothetical protein
MQGHADFCRFYLVVGNVVGKPTELDSACAHHVFVVLQSVWMIRLDETL